MRTCVSDYLYKMNTIAEYDDDCRIINNILLIVSIIWLDIYTHLYIYVHV